MAENTPKKEVNIVIISDSAGDTAFNNAVAAAAQFPDAEINYRRYPFIISKEKLEETFKEIEQYPNLILIDRKSVVQGKSVDRGGRRVSEKKNKEYSGARGGGLKQKR